MDNQDNVVYLKTELMSEPIDYIISQRLGSIFNSIDFDVDRINEAEKLWVNILISFKKSGRVHQGGYLSFKTKLDIDCGLNTRHAIETHLSNILIHFGADALNRVLRDVYQIETKTNKKSA